MWGLEAGTSASPGTVHHCLHESPAALGIGGPNPSPWPTSLSGEKHDGTLVGDGASGLIHGCGGLLGHGAIQLDGSEFPPANGAYSTNPCPSHSHSWSSWTCPRGSLFADSESWCTATAVWATTKTEVPTTPPQEMMLPHSTSDNKPPCPPPWFTKIAQALWDEEPMVSGQPLVIASNHLLWHSTMGAIFIDIQSCALRIVGLGLDPMTDDCPVLTLQELSNSDD